MLSFDTLTAAQGNDLSAIAEVIEATESRIKSLADKAARRMAPHGGNRLAAYREEFAQVGRIAVWEAIGRFTDTTVEAFERYVYTTIERTLLDAVRSERNGGAGADADALKVFAAMVEAAEGDAYEAEKLAQVLPPKGKRLSADRASAARLAWLGDISIDKASTTRGDTEGGTLADTLAHTDEEPDGEIRPKVGRGAVLEAVSVLYRYLPAPADDKARELLLEALAFMSSGNASLCSVEALEGVVSVPADPTTRRYVLDAMGVLRAAISTATDGTLAEELRDVSDERRAESVDKHERVNTVLDSMGGLQRELLRHSFGIGDVTDYGWGDGCDLDGLARALSMTAHNAKVSRGKARKSFAKRYVAAIALVNAAYAAVLDAAAAARLTNAGRK